jgi:hypothetical protein
MHRQPVPSSALVLRPAGRESVHNMDDLRLSAVAARVVAWHNRHPLARRIQSAQVHAIGYVALPFAGTALPVLPAVIAPASAAAPESLEDPLASNDGSVSLRERARVRARQQPARADVPSLPVDLASLSADFISGFIEQMPWQQVERFALGHGRALAQAPRDGPSRQVRRDGPHGGRPLVRVYLLTAVIETGTAKSRLLLGAGVKPAVLGQRVYNLTRIGAIVGSVGGLAGGWFLAAPLFAPSLPAASPVAISAAAVASAAEAERHQPASAQPPSSAAEREPAASDSAAATPPLPLANGPANAAGPAPAQAPASAAVSGLQTQAPAGHATGHEAKPGAATDDPQAVVPHSSALAPQGGAAAGGPPPDVEPRLGRIELPQLGPQRSGAERQPAARARQQPVAVHSAGGVAPAATEQSAQPPASPAPAPAPSAHPAPAPAPFARPAPAALAPAPAGPERAPTTDRAAARPGADFAVSTRPLRTRAEADQVRVAMQALLRSVAAEGVHVDLMPEGDDWRVLALPFSSRAEAEKARALLASRGIRMTVIAF